MAEPLTKAFEASVEKSALLLQLGQENYIPAAFPACKSKTDGWF
jgi:hypothetical protein